MRRVIAARMTQSLQQSAQLTAVQEVDLTQIAELRGRTKDRFRDIEGVSLTPLAFIARATLDALKRFPQFNASLDEACQNLTLHSHIHLGIAIDTPRGLVVPVIHNSEELSVRDLALNIARLAQRARAAELSADELTGSTFTITNIGAAGSLLDTPIINAPEVAILGTGAIQRLPRVDLDESGMESVAVRSVAYLPLTYDHRVIDGAVAGRFLADIVASLETTPWHTHVASYAAD
jgi:2-oxoglutarate dehydrogenase E2 component (dihydrolipoamide succinyltransferase)